jgi:type VI secretion system protein ImpK
MAAKPDTDYDSTIVQLAEEDAGGHEALPFAPVAVAQSGAKNRNALYIAQQTSFDDFTPGLNPLVNAATFLIIEMIKLKSGKMEDIEELRHRLEAEIRSFTNQAQTLGLRESQWFAARYLLCTALDESVTLSKIPGAAAEWASRSLLSTFHEETQGGEVFFQVLDRTMKQPAVNLYLLELAYLLLSLGFEGKYRMQDRGPLELESQRDSLYRQIRILRGEPSPDLSKKLDKRTFKNRIYAYVPMWLIGAIVVFCLAVTFWGFSFTLGTKADPLMDKYATHASKIAPYSAPEQTQPEEAAPAAEETHGTNDATATEASR